MRKSKLFDMLRTFKLEEWKECRNYLNTKVTSESDLIKLYKHIEKYTTDLNHDALDLDKMQKRSFKNSDRKAILNLMSRLSKEIETYWIWEEFKQEHRAYDLFKLKAYNRRGLYDKANKIGEQMRIELSDEKSIDLWNNYYLLAANHERYLSYNPAKDLSSGRKLLEDLINLNDNFRDNLSLYYRYLAMVRDQIKMEDWTSYTSGFKDIINSDTSDFLKEILVLIIEVRELKQYSSYMEIEKLYFREDLAYSEALNVTIYILIKNFLAGRVRSGRKKVNEEYTSFLIRSIFEKKNLYKGFLPYATLNNTISALCLNQYFKQADKLLREVPDLLAPNRREEYISLASMNINFYRGDFSLVIKEYGRSPFGGAEFKIEALPIVLRSYYCDDNSNEIFVENQIRNFKELLKRHKSKMSSSRFDGLENFAKILYLLNRGQFEDVVFESGRIRNLYFRSWVNEVIKEQDLVIGLAL